MENIGGINAAGVVFSEFSDQNPEAWSSIVEPVLLENGGWAGFNFTPKGKDHAHALYEAGLKSLERRLHLLVNWITQKRLRRGQGSRSGVQLRDQLVTLQSSLQDVPEYLRGMGSIQLNDLLTTVK